MGRKGRPEAGSILGALNGGAAESAPESSTQACPLQKFLQTAAGKTLDEIGEDLKNARLHDDTDDHLAAVRRWCLLQLLARRQSGIEVRDRVSYEMARLLSQGNNAEPTYVPSRSPCIRYPVQQPIDTAAYAPSMPAYHGGNLPGVVRL